MRILSTTILILVLALSYGQKQEYIQAYSSAGWGKFTVSDTAFTLVTKLKTYSGKVISMNDTLLLLDESLTLDTLFRVDDVILSTSKGDLTKAEFLLFKEWGDSQNLVRVCSWETKSSKLAVTRENLKSGKTDVVSLFYCKHGPWIYFKSNGTIDSVNFYDAGKPVGSQFKVEQGKIHHEIIWKTKKLIVD